jgi:adenylosuccinate synthase
MNTNWFFKPGRLSFLGDGCMASSGKGKLASFICEHADNWQFVCNAFSAQAGHWVRLDDGREFFYQSLNSCAYLTNKYEKMYLGPDGAIELPALLREYEQNKLKPQQLGIHPLAAIIQEKDMAYERGEVDFDGNKLKDAVDGTKKHGSTCHGTGPARVRKMLRRKDTLLAKDIPQLKEFLCDVSQEIIDRLEAKQAGLLEIAQGFPLSLNHPKFYPYCTNRNVSVSAALDGMFLPPVYAGNVLLNFRTYPIRINSNKYVSNDGKFLTWDEKQQLEKEGKEYQTYKGDSGPWYSDQQELTWEELTKLSESTTPIMEITSVTKLPRRVATWSKINLKEAIVYNRTPGKTFISINFLNYVDATLTGKRGEAKVLGAHPKISRWLQDNVVPVLRGTGATLKFLGTGAKTDDMISL